jgi:hypothetical protein
VGAVPHNVTVPQEGAAAGRLGVLHLQARDAPGVLLDAAPGIATQPLLS